MAFYLVLLSTILALSLTSKEQYVSSPGSNINFPLDSMKNASEHSITKVDIMKENLRLLSENVHQETSYKTEQVVPVNPSLHDTSMSGTVQLTAASTSATNTSSTSTTTIIPTSCPLSGYQLYPGFSCYKAFPSKAEMKNWTAAREQCMGDGADLMVLETEEERKHVYIPLRKSMNFYASPWMGVYIPQGQEDWVTLKGEPAPSTWWHAGQPVKNPAYNCAVAYYNGLLANWECGANQNIICEISP